VVAHNAIKHYDGAILGLPELIHQRFDLDGGTYDLDQVTTACLLASAHGREKGQFISLLHRRVPRRKLMIHGNQQALSKPLDLRVLGAQAIPNIPNSDQLLPLNHDSIMPHQFSEPRKQKDFNVHGFPLEGIVGASVKAKIDQVHRRTPKAANSSMKC